MAPTGLCIDGCVSGIAGDQWSPLRVCALFSEKQKVLSFNRHPERAHGREPKDLDRAKQARARCVCANPSMNVTLRQRTATLSLRSRNGFALRFARLLRCTSQTSTALRMTRTEKHRGWRATIHLALRDRSPLRVCASSRQTVRRFAYIVGGDLRTPRLCDFPPNGAAFRIHCRGRPPDAPFVCFTAKRCGYVGLPQGGEVALASRARRHNARRWSRGTATAVDEDVGTHIVGKHLAVRLFVGVHHS